MNALPQTARWYLYILWVIAGVAVGVALKASLPLSVQPLFLLAVLLAYVAADYFEVELIINQHDHVSMTVVEMLAIFVLPFTQAYGVLVVIAGSLIVDVLRRRPWFKIIFNASQRGLTFLAMWLVYQAIADPQLAPFGGMRGTLAFVAVATVYYTVNTILVGTVIALASGRPLIQLYIDSLRKVHWVNFITLPFGAVLSYLWATNPWLVIPGILPLFMAYHSVRLMAAHEIESRRSKELALQANQLAGKLERLQDTSQAMLASFEPLPLITTVNERLAALFNASASWAVLLDGTPHMVAAQGTGPEFGCDAASFAHALAVRDVRQIDPGAVSGLEGVAQAGWTTLAIIPMRAQGRLVGGFCLAHTEPLILTDDDRRVLLAFATQAALVVEHAQLFAQLRTKQEELIRSSKLAALGTFAAGIAHEFNNLLTAVIGFAQLGLTTDDVAEKDEALEVAMRSCQRGQSITSGLLTFARRRDPKREICQLGNVVQDTIALVQREFAKVNVIIEHQIEPIPYTVCDSGQIAQVLMNLLTNARDAMADKNGGTIRVKLSEQAQMIELRVSDTGHGISPELLSQIFQPFMTTKGALGGGKTSGTGLGLAISHGIIESHGGTIEVQSAPGSGTTMIVRLPIVGAGDAEGDTAGMGGPAQALRILIVDDEPDIGESLRRLLSRYGHLVDLACDARTALQCYKDRRYDLVLSDAIMPEVGGAQLMHELRDIDPEAQVLVMTGQPGADQVNRMLDLGAVGMISKPFASTALLEMIRRKVSRRDQVMVVER